MENYQPELKYPSSERQWQTAAYSNGPSGKSERLGTPQVWNEQDPTQHYHGRAGRWQYGQHDFTNNEQRRISRTIQEPPWRDYNHRRRGPSKYIHPPPFRPGQGSAYPYPEQNRPPGIAPYQRYPLPEQQTRSLSTRPSQEDYTPANESNDFRKPWKPWMLSTRRSHPGQIIKNAEPIYLPVEETRRPYQYTSTNQYRDNLNSGQPGGNNTSQRPFSSEKLHGEPTKLRTKPTYPKHREQRPSSLSRSENTQNLVTTYSKQDRMTRPYQFPTVHVKQQFPEYPEEDELSHWNLSSAELYGHPSSPYVDTKYPKPGYYRPPSLSPYAHNYPSSEGQNMPSDIPQTRVHPSQENPTRPGTYPAQTGNIAPPIDRSFGTDLASPIAEKPIGSTRMWKSGTRPMDHTGRENPATESWSPNEYPDPSNTTNSSFNNTPSSTDLIDDGLFVNREAEDHVHIRPTGKPRAIAPPLGQHYEV